MSKPEEGPEVLPLPELPPEQQGTSTASSRHYTASVSNAAGYLCHIQLNCRFNVSPDVVFEIFSHPDNAGAFRDIKQVGYRKVISSSPGLKVVEVEQLGELRVLFISRIFRTYLHVTEDNRDPECLKTSFALLRSDVLSRFQGGWELRPVHDADGNVVGCDAVLTQDVLPRGVPTFFAHLPVLGGLLRKVSLNTIQRLVEDILYIVKTYAAGGGKLSVGEVLQQIAAERGHKTCLDENRSEWLNDKKVEDNNSKVTSFAIDHLSSDPGSEELEEAAAAAKAAGQHSSTSSHRASSSSEASNNPMPAAAGNGTTAESSSKLKQQQQQQQNQAGDQAALATTEKAAAAHAAEAAEGKADGDKASGVVVN